MSQISQYIKEHGHAIFYTAVLALEHSHLSDGLRSLAVAVLSMITGVTI